MRLQRLEARLRELLEVRLIRALPGKRTEQQLVKYVTEAIEKGARVSPAGPRIAPNVFTLQVAPEAVARWGEPALAHALIQAIQSAASDANLSFDAPPTLTFAEDASLAAGELRVVASHSAEAAVRTQDMKADTDSAAGGEQPDTIPENAFLIVDGVKEFALTSAVINMGRRLDNDLVVDDPRVSRHHAQLRAIKNRFVLFDLNSSGGTSINGQRTSQAVLNPGDVISLAGVSLIFGQDVPLPQRDSDQTGPRSQLSSDQATPIIRSGSDTLGRKP